MFRLAVGGGVWGRTEVLAGGQGTTGSLSGRYKGREGRAAGLSLSGGGPGDPLELLRRYPCSWKSRLHAAGIRMTRLAGARQERGRERETTVRPAAQEPRSNVARATVNTPVEFGVGCTPPHVSSCFRIRKHQNPVVLGSEPCLRGRVRVLNVLCHRFC